MTASAPHPDGAGQAQPGGYVPPEVGAPTWPRQANLGCATTQQLLEELRARIEIDYYSGGGGLSYSTVTGRPSTGVAVEGGDQP